MSAAFRNRSEAKELTLKETLILSPVEKYVYYNKTPTRLFMNIILVILVTLQVSIIFDYTAASPRETERTFRYIFMNATDDESQVAKFNTPMDFQDHLLSVQDIFRDFNDYMFQNLTLETTLFQLHAYYKYPIERKETYNIDIEDGFVEPFNASELNSIKFFIERALQMEITVQNLTMVNRVSQNAMDICLRWSISLLYDVRDFTQITSTISTQTQLCEGSIIAGSDTSVGISFLVLIISFISLFRTITKFLRIGRSFLEIKSAYINYVNHNLDKEISKIDFHKQELADAAGENFEEKIEDYFIYQSWEDVPFSAKMSFFSGWFIFNAIGNVFQLTSSLLLVVSFFSPITAQGFYIAQVVLGFSAFFSWAQLLQYLGYWKDVVVVTTTLQKSANTLTVYFSIAIPVFIGVSMLGYSLFWKYDMFNSAGRTMRTLFAMACGDIVHETFLATWGEGMKSMVFLMVYIIMYFTAFANIFVAIIMEGHSKAEMRKKFDNDDPFPNQEDLKLKRRMSLEIPQRSKENRGFKPPELQRTISKELSDPNLSANAKNTLNLLLFQKEEAKEELEDMIKIKQVIENRNYDQRTKHFLDNLYKNGVRKIIEKVRYYELIFKKSLESRNIDEHS